MNRLVLGFLAVALVLASAQLVLAAPPERTSAFVCPVLNEQAGTHNPNAVPIANGDYTVLGPTLMVPVHATNAEGAGSPAGAHAAPGDADYSPIWNT